MRRGCARPRQAACPLAITDVVSGIFPPCDSSRSPPQGGQALITPSIVCVYVYKYVSLQFFCIIPLLIFLNRGTLIQ